MFKVACRNKACPNLVPPDTPFGWCRECARISNALYNNLHRDRESDQVNYDGAWRELRLLKLNKNPLCELCLLKKVPVEAKQVDHIVPIKHGGKRLDLNNLQSLCVSCHSKKTMRETFAR